VSVRSGWCSRGRPIAHVANHLGIHREALRQWREWGDAGGLTCRLPQLAGDPAPVERDVLGPRAELVGGDAR
jgi:transposase-like protein